MINIGFIINLFGLEYLILWNLYLIGGMENTHLKRCTKRSSDL